MPFLTTYSNAAGNSLLYNCKRWKYTVTPRPGVTPSSEADFIWTYTGVDAVAPGLEGLGPPAQTSGDGTPTAPWPMPTYPGSGALCPSTRPEFRPHMEYCRIYGAIELASSASDGAYVDWSSNGHWSSKTLYATACWRYQRYCCTLQGDGTPRFYTGVPRSDYACLTCSGATYPNVSPEGYCCNTSTPCPSGQVWCATSGACVPQPPPPPCATQLDCRYSPASCSYDCDNPSADGFCPPGKTWDYGSCSCVTPPPPPPPPCADALHCTLNTTTNSWDCDPIPDCPLGESWDEDTCACKGCDPGYCWCIGSGSCVPCAPPLCHTELHCAWNMDDCTWHCDDPTAPGYCPAGESWSYSSCACVTTCDGLSTLHDKEGRYYRASPESSGIQVYRAQFDVPPFVLATAATADGSDCDPTLFLDERQRLHLIFHRDPDVLETVSADFSKHWSTPVTLFTGASRPRGRTHPRNRLRIRAAYKSGHLVGRKEQPNGSLGAEFTFLDTAGSPLAVDDASWDFSPSPVGPKALWVLEVAQSGATHTYRSQDNCLHWELIT